MIHFPGKLHSYDRSAELRKKAGMGWDAGAFIEQSEKKGERENTFEQPHSPLRKNLLLFSVQFCDIADQITTLDQIDLNGAF